MTPVAWFRNAALHALATLAMNASGVVAQDASPLMARVSETATARIGSDGVAGAVIVLLRNGEPVWTEAFGMADPERGLPMTEDALFRVESLSKPVTAWGAMRLTETGRLDLDASAADCLRRWRPPEGTPPFTARQLLSHSAGTGLGDFTERQAPNTERPGLPAHLDQDFEMISAPGARFAYNLNAERVRPPPDARRPVER